ncbi:transcription factor-like 5 protein [Oryzias latipes]|uniref:transcription factor-like 5 protein n=1 Tax=Oryzias latipes TaxID=8090 RepID=UPI0002A499E8|nr:transcription factor-like 5 protein [Oryzias latipes]XP_020560010.1 transcription factor-like 5 protein [Oryzias latipes]
MSSLSSSCKTAHPSPSVREHPGDSVELILTPSGSVTQDQGQMLSSDLGLIDMTEAEFSDLQHFIRWRAEAQAGPVEGPDTRPRSAGVVVKGAANSTVVSPLKSTQAIDLSVSSDDHCLLTSVEKTPSHGEVPGSVLARINREDSPATPLGKFRRISPKESLSSARVCLEKRFNSMCPDTTGQPDIHPTLLSSLLTAFQQSAVAEETAINPQRSKWATADGENPPVGSSRDINPVCGQSFAQTTETNKHPGLVISKSFSFHFYPDHTFPKSVHTSNNLEEEQIIVNKDVETPAVHRNNCGPEANRASVQALPDSVKEAQRGGRKRARSLLSNNQRRERHNITERERRKRIRLCCDELNTMVPFCDPCTDKVTTLTWTTTFLRYITKKYGDTFKEEFGKLFAHKTETCLKSGSSSGQHPIQPEVNEALDPSLAAEQ